MHTEAMTLPAPLSHRLRAETRSAHSRVEKLGFVRAFLRGTVERDTYCRLLVDLHHVYRHLEAGFAAHRETAALRPLYLPELFREHALALDLDFLARADWRRTLRPSAAAQRYAARLRGLSQGSASLLVAHAYTRYLGDLSGGQILRRVAARALGLTGQDGLSFYEFPQIADLTAYKQAFRGRLDSLPLTLAQQAELVAEANRAFALSGAILAECDGSDWRALRNLLWPPRPAAFS